MVEIASQVTSVGRPGADYDRSDGRAYNNVESRLTSVDDLRTQYQEFLQQALEKGRRRAVFRARVSREVYLAAMATPVENTEPLPIEVALPLVSIDPTETDLILMLGKNVHPSLDEVPEWAEVYSDWQQPRLHRLTPGERVEKLAQTDRYQLIDQPRPEHAQDLAQLWAAFGWTVAGVTQFINNSTNRSDQWFSGYVDRATGRLVSACMAESLLVAGQLIVEGTEYATLAGYENQGLCTAAVTALHAHVLEDTMYKTGQMPIIVSEFNLSSRSDRSGAAAGMTIPFVAGQPYLEHVPFQVLRRNVAVLDHQEPNTLNWRDLGDERHHYRDAYRTTYKYWRNFIVGMLPLSAIHQYYSLEQVAQIRAAVTK